VRQLLAQNDVSLEAIRCGPLRLTTPLTVACIYSRVEVINLLLTKDGIDVNFNGDLHGETPLMMAVSRGLEEVVKSLLARDDLKPNITCNSGHHALHSAVTSWNIGMIKSLLDHPGIDLNFMARDGSTALIQAVQQPDVVKLLLDREGIEVNHQDNSGWTALSKAAHYSNLEVAKLLLEREDININLPDNRGWTPLFWACDSGCPVLVALLLKKEGIDPNVRDVASGRTPLAHVCHHLGSQAVAINLLLSFPDTDPDAVDNNGVSVLTDFVDTWRDDNGRQLSSGHHSISMLELERRYYEVKSLLYASGATGAGDDDDNDDDDDYHF
jgi:ankyrin repeat protein